jgi:hypothetical protein
MQIKVFEWFRSLLHGIELIHLQDFWREALASNLFQAA